MGSTPKKFPRTVRELVDHDYVERLSPEDRAWLEKFDDEFYGAAFTPDPLHGSVEHRRQSYRVKNRRNQDIYGRGLRSGGIRVELADDTREWTTHHSDDEYRRVLSEFRANLPSDGRKNVRLTPEFLASRNKMDSVAGVKTRDEGVAGETAVKQMAQSRIDKLKETYRIVMDLGVTVSKHDFKGEHAHAAVRMLGWLEAFISKLDAKLQGLGVDMKAEMSQEHQGGK